MADRVERKAGQRLYTSYEATPTYRPSEFLDFRKERSGLDSSLKTEVAEKGYIASYWLQNPIRGLSVEAPPGSVSNPSYGFRKGLAGTTEPHQRGVGMYLQGTNSIGFAAGASNIGNIGTSGFTPGAANTYNLGASGNPWLSVFGVNLDLGVASVATGTLDLFHASSAFKTTFSAGVQLANIAYTLPTALTVAGAGLVDTNGAGVLGWSAAAMVTGAGTNNQVAVFSGAATLDSSASLTNDGTNTSFTGQMLGAAGTAAAPAYSFTGTTNAGMYLSASGQMFGPVFSQGGSDVFGVNASATVGLKLNSARPLSWASGGLTAAATVLLYRDKDATLALRNSTTAQQLRIYNTFTTLDTDGEWAKLEWASNVFYVGTEKGSGAGTARSMVLQTDDTDRITIGTDGEVTIAQWLQVGTATDAAAAGDAAFGGSGSTAGKLVYDESAYDLTIWRQDASNSTASLNFKKNRSGGSLNTGDNIGILAAIGANSTPAYVTFSQIAFGTAGNVTAGSEAGNIIFSCITSGTSREYMRMSGGSSSLVIDNSNLGFPLQVKSWLEVGTATDAATAGDAAFGLTGAHRWFADAANKRWGHIAANGQQCRVTYTTELTTIAAAATTDTAIQIPANAVVFAVDVRVTVAIPTAVTFTVTGTTSGTQFDVAGGVSVAVNTTDVGTRNCPYKNGAAQTIRITPSAVPAANTGRVRVTIHYYEIVPATS